MDYTIEFDVQRFDFWGGAYDRIQDLTYEQLEQLGEYIKKVFCDVTPSVSDINNFVWFECDDFLETLEKKGGTTK